MLTSIDWGNNSPTNTETQTMKLNTMGMEVPHTIKILDMRMTDGGYIVTTVSSPTLEGNTLWLKGKYGLQNGALSLMQLVGSNESADYIDKSFFVKKEASEKSMSGYRYVWTEDIE